MNSSAGKVEPVLIKMSAVTARDNVLYPKMQKESPSYKVPFMKAFPTST